MKRIVFAVSTAEGMFEELLVLDSNEIKHWFNKNSDGVRSIMVNDETIYYLEYRII